MSIDGPNRSASGSVALRNAIAADQKLQTNLDMKNIISGHTDYDLLPKSTPSRHPVNLTVASGPSPPIGHDWLTAVWLAELHRLYYGGLMCQSAVTMASSFPSQLPFASLMSSCQHLLLQQQQQQPIHAPSSVGRYTARGDAVDCSFDQNSPSSTTAASAIATTKPETGGTRNGVKRTSASEEGGEKRLKAAASDDVGVALRHPRRSGLNDFSIPSILSCSGRFEGRRRRDSGSAGSLGGGISGFDSEDAWSACTRPSSTEPDIISKSPTSSDSENFDDEDTRCRPSADHDVLRAEPFQTMAVNSPTFPMMPVYRFHPQQCGAFTTPTFTGHPVPHTSPMTSPICFRRESKCWTSSESSDGLKKRSQHQQRLDNDSTKAESKRVRGSENVKNVTVSRLTMAADSSSSIRRYECPQCEKVCILQRCIVYSKLPICAAP